MEGVGKHGRNSELCKWLVFRGIALVLWPMHSGIITASRGKQQQGESSMQLPLEGGCQARPPPVQRAQRDHPRPLQVAVKPRKIQHNYLRHSTPRSNCPSTRATQSPPNPYVLAPRKANVQHPPPLHPRRLWQEDHLCVPETQSRTHHGRVRARVPGPAGERSARGNAVAS